MPGPMCRATLEAMSLFFIAFLVADLLSVVVAERFYRRLPTLEGHFVDPRVVFRHQDDLETERWRQRLLVTLGVAALFGLASVIDAWPR